MSTFRTTALALALLASLAACNRDSATVRVPGASAEAPTAEGSVEATVSRAMDKARDELAHGNITLDASGVPKAEITPRGDLLIDGKAVPVTPQQRALLLDYRAQLAGVASAGMDVGVQGAKLATTAVREALRGVFSGKGDEVEKRMRAEAEPIRQAALKLCDRLPALLASQQKLAAALPAFAPYATMDQGDIDDCRNDAANGVPPTPPAPPAPPLPPDAPPAGATGKATGPTASEVIGKPELPELPELPDVTG